MDNSTEMLERQIETEIENLSTMEPGSDEKLRTVDNLTKLYKMKMDAIQFELDKKDKQEDRIVQLVKIGGTLALSIAAIGFQHFWWCREMRFEETGSFLSQTGRDIRRFDPLKFLKN